MGADLVLGKEGPDASVAATRVGDLDAEDRPLDRRDGRLGRHDVQMNGLRVDGGNHVVELDLLALDLEDNEALVLEELLELADGPTKRASAPGLRLMMRCTECLARAGVGGCVAGACGLSGRRCLGLCVGVRSCPSCQSVSTQFLCQKEGANFCKTGVFSDAVPFPTFAATLSSAAKSDEPQRVVNHLGPWHRLSIVRRVLLGCLCMAYRLVLRVSSAFALSGDE